MGASTGAPPDTCRIQHLAFAAVQLSQLDSSKADMARVRRPALRSAGSRSPSCFRDGGRRPRTRPDCVGAGGRAALNCLLAGAQAQDAYKAATAKVEAAYINFEKQVQAQAGTSTIERVQTCCTKLRQRQRSIEIAADRCVLTAGIDRARTHAAGRGQAKADWNTAVAEKNERMNEYLLSLNVLNAHYQRRYDVDQPTMATVCGQRRLECVQRAARRT